ncbi:MAG TPA: hypothetical protein VGD97_01065 [Lacunisphaera sp.]
MNNEEAKFILQGYRPNGADAGDAAFRAALEQVQRDPALREWFARQQAFDAAVSAKLDAVPAPAGLREAILAGGRVTAPVQTQTAWWRAPVWLAAAASVAVIFATMFALWPKQAAAGTALADFVLRDAVADKNHGGHGTGSLQAMLGDPANRLSRGLPISFTALRKDGCRTVTYEGREVLEVCFNRGGVWFHAYIGRRADFPALASVPVFLDKEGVSVASWADETHVYLVASKAGRAALQQLL